ncbi:MAG: cbb3-type cytochrome c oxidase subunit 3 [Ignavibacteriales bacterium]|nr:MAG: cbb3-type cytochrome c oxidase subunit 3 [Ignavibacteriales bacterium]
MYKNILVSIEGIDIFPIISMILFFVFFIGLIIWVLRIDKNYIKEMENIPLDLTESSSYKFTGENHEK